MTSFIEHRKQIKPLELKLSTYGEFLSKPSIYVYLYHLFWTYHAYDVRSSLTILYTSSLWILVFRHLQTTFPIFPSIALYLLFFPYAFVLNGVQLLFSPMPSMFLQYIGSRWFSFTMETRCSSSLMSPGHSGARLRLIHSIWLIIRKKTNFLSSKIWVAQNEGQALKNTCKIYAEALIYLLSRHDGSIEQLCKAMWDNETDNAWASQCPESHRRWVEFTHPWLYHHCHIGEGPNERDSPL